MKAGTIYYYVRVLVQCHLFVFVSKVGFMKGDMKAVWALSMNDRHVMLVQ